MSQVKARLSELGIEIPRAQQPVGAYVPAIMAGNLIFSSGQLPMINGALKWRGKVGKEVSLEEACDAARVCAVNCLAAFQALLGNLDRIKQIVKVTGYVASAPGFTQQPKVVNGASELLVSVFGENGRHARSAVGVAELPLDAPVEVEVVAEI